MRILNWLKELKEEFIAKSDKRYNFKTVFKKIEDVWFLHLNKKFVVDRFCFAKNKLQHFRMKCFYCENSIYISIEDEKNIEIDYYFRPDFCHCCFSKNGEFDKDLLKKICIEMNQCFHEENIVIYESCVWVFGMDTPKYFYWRKYPRGGNKNHIDWHSSPYYRDE